jgi:hypothetical protein
MVAVVERPRATAPTPTFASAGVTFRQTYGCHTEHIALEPRPIESLKRRGVMGWCTPVQALAWVLADQVRSAAARPFISNRVPPLRSATSSLPSLVSSKNTYCSV